MFTYTTAGESHGQALAAILEGLPCGLKLKKGDINKELARRQRGAGRGGRMKIENDQVEIISGIRQGLSLGTPIALIIKNRDWANWKEKMSVGEVASESERLTKPRPGHADLTGILKTGQDDIRNILERASARETAVKVAVGAIAKMFLKEFGLTIFSHVTGIGSVEIKAPTPTPDDIKKIEASQVRCVDKKGSKKMVEEIERAAAEKDTLGGVFEILAYGVPPGLGSYVSWDRRLDGSIAKAIMGIPAIKGVEIGSGFRNAAVRGSEAHDEIYFEKNKGFYRETNRAGGIEGGMKNGEPIVIRGAMKPIPTVGKPLKTVDIESKDEATSFKERADICALPSAGVIAEAALAIELANEMVKKFGGDSLEDLKANFSHYLNRINKI